MSEHLAPALNARRVVFTDANVLYSRVLRDYLLYSAAEGVIEVVWSREVLDEMAKHLMANLPGFTQEAATVLITAMSQFYPDAEINPTSAEYEALAVYDLPDEGANPACFSVRALSG